MEILSTSKLVSSFLFTSLSRTLRRQSQFSTECRQTGLRSSVHRSSVFAQRDWVPASSNASRSLLNEEIGGIPVGEYGEKIFVPNYEDDESDEVGEIKLECDENGCVIVVPRGKTLAEEDNGFGYLRCNLTGCYFTEELPSENTFEVIEGEGWRLGYETAPDSEDSFCAVVGAGGWSIALTAAEFNDFCTLIQAIKKGITTMDRDGIVGKDNLVLQVEKGSLWMECSIPKTRIPILQNLWKGGAKGTAANQSQAFELRFILSGVAGRRQAEGFWPAQAVMDIIKKVDAAAVI